MTKVPFLDPYGFVPPNLPDDYQFDSSSAFSSGEAFLNLAEGLPSLDYLTQILSFKLLHTLKKPHEVCKLRNLKAVTKQVKPLASELLSMFSTMQEQTREEVLEEQHHFNVETERLIETLQDELMEYRSCRGLEKEVGIRFSQDVEILIQPVKISVDLTHPLNGKFFAGITITTESTRNLRGREVQTCNSKSIEIFSRNGGTEVCMGLGVKDPGGRAQTFIESSLSRQTNLGEVGASLTLQGLDSPILRMQKPLLVLRHAFNKSFKHFTIQKQTNLILTHQESQMVPESRARAYQIQQVQQVPPPNLSGGYKAPSIGKWGFVLVSVLFLRVFYLVWRKQDPPEK